jgi:HAMP domain-containing protein
MPANHPEMTLSAGKALPRGYFLKHYGRCPDKPIWGGTLTVQWSIPRRLSMKHKTGKEMRKLMMAVSVSVLLLVLAIITYFMVDIIVTTNANIEKNKELVIEQSVYSLIEIGSQINEMTKNPTVIGLFNQDVINKIISGDMQTFYAFIGRFAIPFYPIEYVGIVQNGEVVTYETKGGVDVDPQDLPTEPPEGEYETLDSLGGEEGFFVSVFYPVELTYPGMEPFYVNMIVDRTDELTAVTKYFEDQRNDLILRLSIASIITIILSLLLTTFGLRYFTRKYVVDPIEELNRTAEEIADGTFEGEVQVDEESAYAALQGLLRSGQKVLSRLDDEIRE